MVQLVDVSVRSLLLPLVVLVVPLILRNVIALTVVGILAHLIVHGGTLHPGQPAPNAAHFYAALHTHEAVLAPPHAPAVLDEPIVIALIRRPIAHHQDGVVVRVVRFAAVKDAALVGLELVVGGHHADDCPLAEHQLLQPVLIATDSVKVVRDAGLQAGVHLNVFRAVQRGICPHVRILVLSSQVHFVLHQQVEVGVRVGAMTTVGSLVAEATVNELLLRVIAKPMGDPVEAGLDGPHGGKGHAGAALALVLHRRHVL